MALTASMQATVSATQTKTIGLIEATIPFAVQKTISLASGTATNQSDLLYQDSRTLVATSEEIDLAGILAGIFGDVNTFVEVTGIYIENTNTTAGAALTVGGAATNAFVNWVGDATDKVKIGPGGFLFLANPVDGYAVTAGTGDKLKIDAGAATILYKITIFGRSA